MNKTKHMHHAEKIMPCPLAATMSGPERLPVRFAADFPVEFTIRRLVDVPLRVESKNANFIRPTC